MKNSLYNIFLENKLKELFFIFVFSNKILFLKIIKNYF